MKHCLVPFPEAAVIAAALLLATSLCRGGEITCLETFDAFPYPFVSANQHASYLDWPNGDLQTAATNGGVRGTGGFPPYNPGNPIASLRSLVLVHPGEIRAGGDLELRADVLKVTGDGAFAALGWQVAARYEIGYFLLRGASDVALVKCRFDQGMLAPLLWEPLSTGEGPVTLALRFSVVEEELGIQVQVLDQATGGVLLDRTVMDTPAADPVAACPPPLVGSPDPGPHWEGLGNISLGLFRAGTNFANCQIEVDNFGMRQTRAVTGNDFLPLVYIHAPGKTLPYRLFTPAQVEPGASYPLVLYLHSAECPGSDNVRQMIHPEMLEFVSPRNQSKHPCFMVVPQMPVSVFQANSLLAWLSIKEQVVGLLASLQSQHPIDPDRVYLAGASMGGTGVWSLLAKYPDRFAAAVPICGLGTREWLPGMAHVPIWVFSGAKDKSNPVDGYWGNATGLEGELLTGMGQRRLIAELRRLGACPLHTEYADAGHGMTGLAFDTAGLVDWVMAQRRGEPVQALTSIFLTTPVSNGVWTTSYPNVDLTGWADPEAGLTNVAWRNETTSQTGSAAGSNQWSALAIPLRAGRGTGTTVVPSTNVITVTGTSPSGSEYFGGTTTRSAALRVIQVPVRVEARMEGGRRRLDWSGVSPSFVVQRSAELSPPDWMDVLHTGETNAALLDATSPTFYRVRLP